MRRYTSPSRKTSYQPLLHSYYIAAVVLSYLRVRLAGHGFCVVAEIVGFDVAEIVGYLLLCAKLAAALAAGSTAFFENR